MELFGITAPPPRPGVKPFKSEWATVKDGDLWVGSTGKEWTNLTDGTPPFSTPMSTFLATFLFI